MSFPRLRIAFVTFKFGHQYGGAEAYGTELMRELALHHDVHVYTHIYDSACPVQLPHTIVDAPAAGPSWWRTYTFAKNIEKELAHHSFDIVHSHVNGWVADVDVLHVKSVRYHWITQASPLKRLWHHLSPRIAMYLYLEQKRVHLKPPKRTVVVSELVKNQLQLAYQTQYPFDVVTPGVQLPSQHSELRHPTRRALGFSDTDHVGLFVARNPRSKGLNTLLSAMQTLPAQVKLLIVGVAAPKINSLRHELVQLALQDRVVLIEQSPTIEAYFQAADFAVHPTLNDSFGMAPLEAMSHRLPVILSQAKYCGLAHYVEHEKQALVLHDPRDSGELAAAITHLLHNPVLSKTLGNEGHALAEQLSWGNIAKRYLLIYAEILAAQLHRARPTLVDPLEKNET
ncbi:glycosyltransferase family 4 protein [Paenalcaligenes hominis]|uniref:glycosyltransferase family 4 protein n=1 Tax=Paenalcaligenes hominis TaxID=643674 RepID=UPI0035259E48